MIDLAAMLLLLDIPAATDLPQMPPKPAAGRHLAYPAEPRPATLLAQAEAGDATAQYNLGNAYYNGDTGTVDYDQARRWWTKAAAHQDKSPNTTSALSTTKAAAWYKTTASPPSGTPPLPNRITPLPNTTSATSTAMASVPQNAYIARDWQEKAAAQGDSDAMYALGTLYQQGELGISGSGQQALTYQWLEKAAMRGHPHAQNELANLYERGEGVPRDLTTAQKWREAAADLGDEDAKDALAHRNGEH